jgi:predicted transcriptional regulator
VGSATMRRTKSMIFLEILTVCNDGANKTRIVYNTNINFRLADSYIDLLMDKGLITAFQGNLKLYKTTERGKNLVRNLEQVNDALGKL